MPAELISLRPGKTTKPKSAATATPTCVGKAGLEPARLAAHDPKSCSSANSDTSPSRRIIPLASSLAICRFLLLVLDLSDISSKRDAT